MKADLSSKEEHFTKGKLGIMLLKVKEFWLTISKNTGIWGTGSMICQMERANRYGEMGLLTKDNFLTVRNTAKVNTSFQIAVFMKGYLNTIDLTEKAI